MAAMAGLSEEGPPKVDTEEVNLKHSSYHVVLLSFT